MWGLERGYCLMIGGEDDVVGRLQPIFEAIAPGVEAAERTPGRTGELSQAERGYLHCGPNGAGHFVKMVHNGIEYGATVAYAEGLNILRSADTGATKRAADAETAPLEYPQFYRYDFDLASVAEVWLYGEQVSPQQCLVVGDTPHDVEGAHAAGIACVGVASHNFAAGQLRAGGADYVIASLKEGLPL